MYDLIDNQALRDTLVQIKTAFECYSAKITIGSNHSLMQETSLMELHIPPAIWMAMDSEAGIRGEAIGMPAGCYQIGPRHYTVVEGFGTDRITVHCKGSLIMEGEVHTEIEFTSVVSKRDMPDFFRTCFLAWRAQQTEKYNSDAAECVGQSYVSDNWIP